MRMFCLELTLHSLTVIIMNVERRLHRISYKVSLSTHHLFAKLCKSQQSQLLFVEVNQDLYRSEN